MPLADPFIAQLPEALRADLDPAAIEALLDRVLAEARQAYPEVQLDPEAFVRFVAERIPSESPVDESLLQLKTKELYLVCACLRDDRPAMAVFESTYLPETEAAVAKMRSATARADDVRQVLHQKLLVKDGDQPAKLSRYSGKGELKSWLRVTATRAALDMMRENKKTDQLDDTALMDHLAAPGDDQELQYLKQHYRAEFKAAFQATLATLSSRERNVLRLQLLDGLNIDQVGAIHRVHRATVARWNQKLREKLLSATRRALLTRLQIDRTEFESIMRLIQSQFDVSICRHLDPPLKK